MWGLVVLVSSGLEGLIAAVMILWVLSTTLLVFANKVGLTWLITWFAERDIWWSPIRMKPGPGYIKMMTKGFNSGGPFAMVIPGHIPYWHYHEDRNFYDERDKVRFQEMFPNRPPTPTGWFEKKLDKVGAVWVGFLRRFYKRKRQWDTWDPKTNSVITKETKPGEEEIFYFATTMAFSFDKIPTKDFGSAEGQVVFNTLMINPEKAEFLAGKPEIQVMAAVRSRNRDFVTSKTTVELQQERDERKMGGLVKTILLANKTQEEDLGLLPAYGMMVQGPRFEDYDFVEEGGAKDVIEARRRLVIANIDVETAKTKANEAEERGKGKARERQAEVTSIRATVEAWGTHRVGGTVAMAEAIKEAKPKAVGGNIIAGINTDE